MARAESSSPDAIADNVDRAAKLLDQIIKETVEQIFVEEAVEEVIPGDDDDVKNLERRSEGRGGAEAHGGQGGGAARGHPETPRRI